MDPAVLRRIGAIYLPDLSCELSSEAQDRQLPLAVVEVEDEGRPGEAIEEIKLRNILSAANDVARRFGVRAGQTVAEARALVSNLAVRGVTRQALRRALGRVAEVALAFGPTVAIDPGDTSSCPATLPDTVWIDLTGTTHLHGGEEATLLELASRVRELGHRVRAAIADGPRLSRAAAVFGTAPESIVAVGGGGEMMQSLPLEALPLSPDRIVWLHRLGLWTVGDLTKLPREASASRLSPGWFELAAGRDDAPLVAYEPPRAPSETIEWEDPISSVEPLLFALSGLVSRLSARLEGRGEAAQSIELSAPYDRSIAKLRNLTEDERSLFFRIDLPSPLAHKADLFRVLKNKLEHTELSAPVVGMSVTAALLTHAPRSQLVLDGEAAENLIDPRAMAILLAELSSEIGKDNVGVLELSSVYRPEGRTRLVPLNDISRPVEVDRGLEHTASDAEFPTRLLSKPVPLTTTPHHDLVVSIDHQLYTVRNATPSMRFEDVEWWTPSPMSRDYMRVWLNSGSKNVQAWIFVDRKTGQAFLHGYFD